MHERVYHVLFICPGNCARRILAEALLNNRDCGRFKAHSAGSRPAGEVHPLALELLERLGLPTIDLRSKSRREFDLPDSPAFDCVVTLAPLWGARCGKVNR